MSYDYCPANFTGSPQHLCQCIHGKAHIINHPDHECICGYTWSTS